MREELGWLFLKALILMPVILLCWLIKRDARKADSE